MAEEPQDNPSLGKLATGVSWYDAFVRYGISFEDGAISALMSFPSMKENVENKNRLIHGKRVLHGKARFDEADYTLPFHIVARNREDFFEKYNAFKSEVLSHGYFALRSAYIPDETFRLEYQSCTQLTQYRGEMAVFNLKVNEPEPTNRS